MKPTLPYPPPWQDRMTLAAHLCISPESVENWVRAGTIPPARMRSGKLMWKWSEVDAWMTEGNPEAPGSRPGSIKDAVKREREADARASH